LSSGPGSRLMVRRAPSSARPRSAVRFGCQCQYGDHDPAGAALPELMRIGPRNVRWHWGNADPFPSSSSVRLRARRATALFRSAPRSPSARSGAAVSEVHHSLLEDHPTRNDNAMPRTCSSSRCGAYHSLPWKRIEPWDDRDRIGAGAAAPTSPSNPTCPEPARPPAPASHRA